MIATTAHYATLFALLCQSLTYNLTKCSNVSGRAFNLVPLPCRPSARPSPGPLAPWTLGEPQHPAPLFTVELGQVQNLLKAPNWKQISELCCSIFGQSAEIKY